MRELITDGYIEQNSLKDPRKTKNEMNGCVIVQYNQSYKKYEYDYVDETCRSINTNYNLTSSDPEYVCYDFDQSTGTIINYDNDNPDCSIDVVIPNKIDGVNVQYISNAAFMTNPTKWCYSGSSYVNIGLNDNCASDDYHYDWENGRYIKSVEFPVGLIGIGECAFCSNMISEVNFSDLTNLRYINQWAFDSNQIETVTFSNMPKLEYLGNGAFYGNYINSVELKDLPNLEEIGFGCFEDNNVTSVRLQGLSNLYVIYGDAFASNQVTTLVLENLPRLERIGHVAFGYNNISSVNFTGLSNLQRIGGEAFAENNLTSVNLSGLFKLNSIGWEAFKGNHISSLIISDLSNLEYIEYGAFEANKLTSLNLTGLTNLEGIDDRAFADNDITSLNLTGLTYLTFIGDETFAYNNLSSVTIPASVIEIGWNAFYQDSSYPWSSVTIEYNGTNPITRFNADWEDIGWPLNLIP